MPTRRKQLDHGVRVKGVDNLLVRLSRCCHPVPGDEIKGFVTQGRGVSVHRADCPNLVGVEEARMIPVEWEGGRISPTRWISRCRGWTGTAC